MIEESIEGNDPLMTPARKHNNKGPTRPNQIKLRKNTQPDNTHPKTLLPKKTDSPEISNKKKVTGMGQKYQENILGQKYIISYVLFLTKKSVFAFLHRLAKMSRHCGRQLLERFNA